MRMREKHTQSYMPPLYWSPISHTISEMGTRTSNCHERAHPPFLHQISLNPLQNLPPQPDDILRWVVPSGVLPLSIRSPTNVDNVNQRISMPKVVQELISQPSPFVSTRYKTRDVEELNGYGAFAIIARAVVRFALVWFTKSNACAVLDSNGMTRWFFYLRSWSSFI